LIQIWQAKFFLLVLKNFFLISVVQKYFKKIFSASLKLVDTDYLKVIFAKKFF